MAVGLGQIRIDDHFVRVSGKSFALSKINSVEVSMFRRGGLWRAQLLGVLAIMLMFAWSEGAGPMAGVAGLLLLAWATLIYFQRSRRRYRLLLGTPAGEQVALESVDRDEAERVRVDIEAAIAR